MYNSVVLRQAPKHCEETDAVACYSYSGVSKSTGNRIWLCSESKSELKLVAMVLKATRLERESDIVLLDNLLNRNESVFLVSPADGIGGIKSLDDGTLLVESRGKSFKIPPEDEVDYGIFEGL